MPTPTNADAPTPTTVGPCSRPLLLRATRIDMATGELLPSLEVERRCGSRLATKCPSCSALYVGDAKAVIRSGLFDEEGTVKQATLVTLTAPGAGRFGQTHRASRDKKGKRLRPCACGKRHPREAAVVGTPLDPDSYDYAAAAAFNAAAGRLATVTFQKLSRVTGRKLQVMRVVEFQRRGLVHIHALVIGEVAQADLDLVVSGGPNPRTGRRIQPASHDGWTWGPRCDARILRVGADPSEAAARTVGYVTKVIGYVTKAAADSAKGSRNHGDEMAQAGEESCTCDNPQPDCRAGVPYGPTGLLWQSKPAAGACRRHSAARRGWGFRGHVLSVTRNWGTTFAAVRELRRRFARGADTAQQQEEQPTAVLWQLVGYAPDKGRRRRPLDDVQQLVTPQPPSPLPARPRMRANADAPGTVQLTLF